MASIDRWCRFIHAGILLDAEKVHDTRRSPVGEVNNVNNATNSLSLNHLLVHCVRNNGEQREQSRRALAELFK
jgi:hypothetical protein